MILIKRKVNFYLSRKQGRTECPLRCRISWNSCKSVLYCNVGYCVSPEKWDLDAQRCLPKTFHTRKRTPAATINSEIERFESVIRSVFDKYEKAEKIPDKEDFRLDLSVALGQRASRKSAKKTIPSQVSSLIDLFATEQGIRNSWTKTTLKAITNMQNHLQEFNPKLEVNDFNEACLNRYVEFLRTDKVNKDGEVLKPGLSNTTLTKQLGYLRWFLNWADTKGYLTVQDYKSYRPKFRKAPAKIIFLEWPELMKVMKLQFDDDHKHLDKIRDIFCFSCFTSLRYSDVMNLRWQDIRNNAISIVTQKTADPVAIELNTYAQEIIGKYAEEDYPDNRVFPHVINQTMNLRLRDVARLAGLNTPVHRTWYKGGDRFDETVPKWQLITSHCGRRTFICNALSMGIAPSIVMKWTGHSDYSAMKPYIEISQTATSEAMKKFDRK